MLPYTTYGTRGPLIVALHWLSGSAATWVDVGEALAERGAICVALDLPGFGRAADHADTSIATSVSEIIETLRALRTLHSGPWALVGHSMGGKMAAIVARAASDGEAGLEDLRGVVLVSPSPPGVEPMSESTRRKMMQSLGQSTREADKDREHAQNFVEDNLGKLALTNDAMERAVDDVLRMSRAGFRAWLANGSKEDWAARVGVLQVPALVMAGSEESALGPDVQAKHTLPHFADAELRTLEGGGHLGPIERPREIAERAIDFLAKHGLAFVMEESQLDDGFRALIESERTTPQTREVLLARMNIPPSAEDDLSAEERMTLRAMLRRVLPGCGFDLLPRIGEWLREKTHDGWRHDALPPDAEAWRKGLRSIEEAALREHGVPFVAVDDARQDELLQRAQDGAAGGGWKGALGLGNAFAAAEMKAWFGDFCAEVTKLYVSDPRAMQRMGFTGFADDGGFTQIRLDERERFEREETSK
jgi:pimeloyl-ACP methyl ester carboxylesterase